jgi:hypothetical protein
MLIAYLKDWIQKTAELGWYLPKKTILCQPIILLASRPQLNKQPEDLPGQYYLLKRILQSYHNIAEKGGWDPIVLSKKSNHYNPEIL